MDVCFEEAVFQADQDIQEGQLIGGGGDGELDGGVKRVDVLEEHIQILWGPRPREENVVDETFPCVLADGDRMVRSRGSIAGAFVACGWCLRCSWSGWRRGSVASGPRVWTDCRWVRSHDGSPWRVRQRLVDLG